MRDARAGLTADTAAAVLATRLIFLVSGLGMSAWAPMVPYAKSRLGLDDAQLGLLLLFFGGGSMASMPLVGWLSHRFGHRRVIAGAAVLMAFMLPVLAMVPSSPLLALALLVFGAALGIVDVAMNAHAVEVEWHSGRVLMSGFHGWFSLGGLAGALLLSALLALGLPLALAAGVLAAGLIALVAWLRSRLLPGSTRLPAERQVFALPHGRVLLLGLLCFVSFLAEGAMLDWSALFLRDFRAFAPSSAGIGYACFSVAMACGRLGGDRLVARLGPEGAVRTGAGLAAFGLALAAGVPWAPATLAGFVLVGLGAANIVPVMFSAAGRQPDSTPAQALAAVTLFGYLGLLSGPALIGLLSRLSSLPWALFAVAALLLGVAAAARIVRPDARSEP
ncbi:MAG: MFS transporter [Fulvimonas sp.]|nr:MFS transporter [Fulvimonas sp.]